MDSFTSGGVFWLPGDDRRRVPGELRHDSDGTHLVLHGDTLEPFSMPDDQVVGISPEWKTIHLVHGRLHDDRPVTLLDVSGVSFPGPFETVHESWTAAFVLFGSFVGDEAFDQAEFAFDSLLPWLDPPGITADDQASGTVVADPSVRTVCETSLADGTAVSVHTGGAGTWDHARVALTQWATVECSGAPRPLRDVLNDWVRPVQDLLIVALGRPVRLTLLRVRPPGSGSRDVRPEVAFAAVQPPPGAPPTTASLGSYDAPTLLTANGTALPLAELLRRWTDARAEHSGAVSLLCGPQYAPFMYSEHRYAWTFQAAEALSKKRFATRDKSRRPQGARRGRHAGAGGVQPAGRRRRVGHRRRQRTQRQVPQQAR